MGFLSVICPKERKTKRLKRKLYINQYVRNAVCDLVCLYTAKIVYTLFYSLVTIILAKSPFNNASLFNSQPQFAIKAGEKKAADESCLFINFNIKSGNIADCLVRCLENCRCQSFQICQNTKCQLCSSHKEENSSLLHDEDDCIYATYETRHLTETAQVLGDLCGISKFHVLILPENK